VSYIAQRDQCNEDVHPDEKTIERGAPESNLTGDTEQERKNGHRAPGGDRAHGEAPAAIVPRRGASARGEARMCGGW
jgi:hypothetical protein